MYQHCETPIDMQVTATNPIHIISIRYGTYYLCYKPTDYHN